MYFTGCFFQLLWSVVWLGKDCHLTCNKAQALISIARGVIPHEVHSSHSLFLWEYLGLLAVNDRSDHLPRPNPITAIDLYLSLARELSWLPAAWALEDLLLSRVL